ncbi:MAG TPA: alternative ribosome rescue aminoacyl-tRNA hydrolase ArfB [Myxococcota bacterium]|nr:alternative ribosome rescue aminoacyl-tRNA hydrolase ArfB [Myxococcota bacterium]
MAQQDLRIAPGVAIPDHEIVETASRSRGPGGQNVNKVETRVTLRWDALRSQALHGDARARALHALAGRLTRSGELIVRSDRSRSRERNREFARERLASLVAAALERPRPRVKTKPTRSSKERRLQAKRSRAERKRGRGSVRDER